MRYIGRIITTAKIDDAPELIEVTNDSSSISGDDVKIPTLIIGYKNAVKLCGKIKITEKKVRNNLYWTFSKRERRSDYISDLSDFYEEVSRFVLSCCGYEYLDPITWSDEMKDNFIKIMSGNRRKVIYSTDTMYYIYSTNAGKTYGMSKTVMKYLGFPDNYFEICSGKKFPSTTIINESDFQEARIAKNKFIQPLLYYLATF